MNDHNESDELGTFFADIAVRPEPSTAAADKAFGIIETEWDMLQQRRKSRRQRRLYALAASVVIGVTSVFLLQHADNPTIQIQFAQGSATVTEDGRQQVIDRAQPLEFSSGSLIASIGTSRWTLGNSTEIRLADNTQARWTNNNEIELLEGDVYVATDGNTSFTVQTKYGRVTDIGTRFMVSADVTTVEVAVREGLIKLESSFGEYQSRPTTESETSVTTVTSEGVNQLVESSSDDRWTWIHSAPAGYKSDEPLVLLREIARDLGKQLEYKALGVEASLGTDRDPTGNYEGMPPLEALEMLGLTFSIDWQIEEDVITVDFKD